jgi:hypothetical protein
VKLLVMQFPPVYSRLQRTDVEKSNVFWDVTPCRFEEVQRRFGGTSPSSSGSTSKPSK